MDFRYLPTDPNSRLFHLVEEMGEVAMLIGKAGRFGTLSYHPSDTEKRPNAELLLRELDDLEKAITAVRSDLQGDLARRQTARNSTR